MDSLLVTVKEAANYLRLSRATIYNLMESGHMPYVKIGKSRRIPRQNLCDMVTKNIVGGWNLK